MKTPYIAVIHTSPATVELFAKLLRERLPDARISNILDDSILPQLRDNGGDVAAVEPRWREYVRIAQELGADVILNACSSIGELCAPVGRQLGVPIVRVDSKMAHEAVARGRRVGVVATLASTLRPTCAVVQETARREGHEAEVSAVLVDGAYAALVSGDQTGHDQLVVEALHAACAKADVVVLAQASMARVLPHLSAGERAQCLVSPPLAVENVMEVLEEH